MGAGKQKLCGPISLRIIAGMTGVLVLPVDLMLFLCFKV